MKTFFLNLDRASQRILVIAFALSIVMLSASCLLLTIDRAYAKTAAQDVYPDIIGLGVDDTNYYYLDNHRDLKSQPKKKY